MPATNVKSYWSGGDLYFADVSNNVIFYIDGTNRQMVFPSGSVLSLPDIVLAAADVALAEGNVLVGNASGAAAALDASGNAKILVGNGTTATSVAVSGDVTIDNAGAVTIAAEAVEASMLITALRDTFLNGLRSYVADGMLAISTLLKNGGAPDAAFKTTTTAIYRIAGTHYTKAATGGLTFSAADTINTAAGAGDFWGVWLVQTNAAGTVSTKSPSADQVYASEAAAIAALPAVDASNIQLGYITVEANNGASWTANTDDLTAASDCQAANFYDLPAPASLPAAL